MNATTFHLDDIRHVGIKCINNGKTTREQKSKIDNSFFMK